MGTNYSFTSANINSSSYRLAQRPTPASQARRIARLQQWLQDRQGYEWTAGFKAAAAELKELEGAK
jgi:hypothetical protein